MLYVLRSSRPPIAAAPCTAVLKLTGFRFLAGLIARARAACYAWRCLILLNALIMLLPAAFRDARAMTQLVACNCATE